MKIFVLGGRKEHGHLELCNYLAKTLREMGHSVDTSQLERTHDYDSEHFEDAYHKNVQSIKKCDLVIVESSESSSGLGFLMANALAEKKPVLSLSQQGSYSSVTLKGVSSKMFRYATYTKSNLKKELENALNKIRKTLDTKFILIISPEIDRYLGWVSENRRMHKAQVVRSALEEAMEHDKEYNTFLKQNK